MTDDTGSAGGSGTPAAPTATAGTAPALRMAASPAVKFFAIAFLTGLLTVPLLMVWALTMERDQTRRTVLDGIRSEWGGEQTVMGPLLVVPYTMTLTSTVDGREVRDFVRRHAVFTPERLEYQARSEASVREVAIYEAVVFRAAITGKGRFRDLSRRDFTADTTAIHWSEATIAVVVGDRGGIESAAMTAGASDLSFEPGNLPEFASYDHLGVIVAALPAGAGVAPGGDLAGFDFDLSLALRGHGSLAFATLAEETEVSIASNWAHPSFVGMKRPSADSRDEAGFTASWTISALARSAPLSFVAEGFSWYAILDEKVGVTFTDPIDFYALMDRALKYGIMFVAAVFGIVFVLEVLSKRRIHVVQYTLVGLIVVFFYVLLLALAEHVGFGRAYLAASTATGGVVAAFVGLALASVLRGVIAAVAFAALFATLYAILRLEDMALLTGALFGFTVLSVVLFATRRVDWTGRSVPPPAAAG